MKICQTCHQAYADDLEFCSRDGTRLAAQATGTEVQLSAGLSRRFRIIRRLGAGGMGTVFLAEQIGVGNRPVALKVLNRKLLDDSEFLARFQNEAGSTGRIRHVNVVTIYESAQAEDGTPYIAMEYLEGESLRDALTLRGPLPVPQVAEILLQAARGLNAAHKLGIIHRDLKPDNIFLTHGDEGELIVKVVDFGIAKLLRESALHTQTGMVVGTPAYMSCEQASGMRSDDLDARSDVYSLGVVVYEMLTGRLPFHSDTLVGYLLKHVMDTPLPFRTVAPLVNVPVPVENAVMKALIKDRSLRHASILDFARELVKAAQPSPRAEAPVAIHPTSIAPRGKQILPGDPREVKVNPKDGLKYAWIPPGTFMMGCSPGDTEYEARENPPHEVTITKGYWLGQTQVTVGAYQRFAAATGKGMPDAPDSNPGWSNEQMPMSKVAWDDAMEYCAWAGGRLPTEAEWEYAARAGSTEARYGPLDEVAWYFSNSGGQTHAVGQKRANEFGLYDTLGNLSEWVNDWFDEKYYESSPSQDPAGPASGTLRALRGGSWASFRAYTRVSVRGAGDPAGGFGFRCIWEAGIPSAPAVPLPPARDVQPPEQLPPDSRLEVRVNPKDGLKYMWIPPGTFMMGCSPGDTECTDSEKPPHEVYITKGFWLGQTEVTVGAYKHFAGATGKTMPEAPDFDPGWSNERMPMVKVGWGDAQSYCAWAGGRLPTEAEWEYAARAGSTEARPGPLDEIAWYEQNSGGQTHPVGEKRANGFGLYDMLGNVGEWVNDWFDWKYYQSSLLQDPAGPASGIGRVLRGGSWNLSSKYVRVSARGWSGPADGGSYNGFRCVREVDGA